MISAVKSSPSPSSISKITTPKNLLSEVASGSVKVSQNVVMPFLFPPGTRRAGGLSKKEGTRATGTLSSVLIVARAPSSKTVTRPRDPTLQEKAPPKQGQVT